MGKDRSLVIPFVGLKEGLHQFDFKIDALFFEQFEYSIVKEGNFEIHLDFYKRVNMMELKFAFNGEIYTVCDRCGSSLAIPVSSEEEMIVKFGEEQMESTDEILIIPSSEHKLDLNKVVYEFINLLMPIKTEHENIENCDQKMIEKLEELNIKDKREGYDPRWSALSELRIEKEE